jgi:RNA processing factor Prp31
VCCLLPPDLRRAQLGLAHSYSRAKVKFNVNKVDNMVIQAIALLDTLDKDINTFIMRVREWYSWHFPELIKVRGEGGGGRKGLGVCVWGGGETWELD